MEENIEMYYIYIQHQKRKRQKQLTIKKKEGALTHLEKALSGKSLKKFSAKEVDKILEYIKNLKFRGRPVSANTKINLISQIRLFLQFLKNQPGFKRIITHEIIDCFNLSYSEKRIIKNKTTHESIKFPTLQNVIKIIDKIDTNTIIGYRDRAIISYLFLTGARISAATTMKIGLFLPEERVAIQDPSQGVKTKNSKFIRTVIPRYSQKLFRILTDWKTKLISAGFTDEDPLFPKAEPHKKSHYLEFTNSTDFKPEFVSPTTLEKKIKNHCIEAGFPDFHAHSFRHAHIAHGFELANSISELKAISQNVGHNNIITTTGQYAELSDEKVKSKLLNLHNCKSMKRIPEDLEYTFIQFLELLNNELYEKYYKKEQK